MAVIKVPKTPKSAFNKRRPASALLRAHVEHLEAAVGIYPSATGRQAKAATARKAAMSEGEAAEYIGALTRQLAAQAAPGVPAEAPVQAAPAVQERPKRSGGKPARATAARKRRAPARPASKKAGRRARKVR